MRNKPTPPSQMLVRPKPKSRKGLTREVQIWSAALGARPSSPSPSGLAAPAADAEAEIAEDPPRE